MAWLPSHQELREHPKLRRAARSAGVTIPTMIGHLHMLWWWALDHAPDGDLGKYDDDDLADAAMWLDDPELFVAAIRDCGPRGSFGFIEPDGKLHDWDVYGGKYAKRVAAAQKAAAARWDNQGNANASVPQSEGNAIALPMQCDDDAEESRGDKKVLPRKRATQLPKGWEPTDAHRELAKSLSANHDIEVVQFRDHHTAKGTTYKDWDAAFRTWLRNSQKFSTNGKQQTASVGGRRAGVTFRD